MTRSLRPAPLLALAGLALLAGCGRSNFLAQKPTAPCPRVALMAETVDLTRYRAGARPDVGTVEVDARMTGFQARCDYAPRDAGLDVTLVVQVEAERGAAGTRAVELPYVVAVTEGDGNTILNRAADTVRVTFDGNARRSAAQGEQMMVRIPGNPQRAAEKTILLGFQLSPEELAANRRRGVR